ncbi:MAG TPA: alpha/beta fold hydrolase [Acidimicrobiales bacterium]|jgi:2-succinyl-6-hydroxy-2,4-cyclohexadiene-1-carboxylate synthase|nr:alpha/beta fold hydrolase [Acidimicrobiales bacterium]
MSPATPPTIPPPAPRSSTALHTETTGRGPRLVLAHGFTQTGRVWGSMDDDLARDHEVVRVDLPGHGASSAVAAGLADGALLLGEAGGQATYVGYSMGARFCLHLALARPAPVVGLVLISATAGIDLPAERLARRRTDEAMAEQLDPTGGPASTATPVETFIRRWLEGPLFAGISPEASGLGQRLANTGPGLASSLRLAGTGTQPALWGRLGELTMPVLIITGGSDEKFTALGGRMAAAIGPNATHAVVAGTNHAPHLQRPREVAALVRGQTRPVAR